jgi:pSer/pThr/pTyr-binding forkhead associated (FHA) protein
MIQLRVITGKQAGSTSVARRFPFRVGRAPDADLVVDDPGVWDEHVAVQFVRGEGYWAQAQGEALLTINGEPVREQRLHNGDVIAMGGARLQFWLGETRQAGFRLREFLVWAGIAAVTLAQVALIYQFSR